MSASKRENLSTFSFYLLLAAGMTWPLLGSLTTHVPLGANDLWQNYWNMWWWKQALLGGRSPYFTDLLFYPDGAPLGLHTHSPANMLLAMPLNLVLGVAAAYNLAIFAGFVLAGLGGFLLAREYTRKSGPAVLAGIIAAYFPQHVESSLEHLNLASYWALPLFLWALVRTTRRGGRWWMAAGFLFSLNALLAWHNALMAIPMGVVVLCFEATSGSRPLSKVAQDLGRAALLAITLLAPFVWPLVRDTRAGVAQLQKGFPDRSIDPLSLFVPHSGHPLWGASLTDLQIRLRRYPAVGSLGYVGWMTWLLTLLAVTRARRWRSNPEIQGAADPPSGSSVLWGALFAFFLLLSFGETPASSFYQAPEWLLLPFHWLKSVPLFGLVRLPNRFFVPAMLSLAVFVAIGIDRLLSGYPPPRRKLIIGCLALLLILDYLWLPYPMRQLPHPTWITTLDELPADLAVLDVSTSHRGSGGIDMYLQTLHRRPIVGGYITTNLESTSLRLRRNPQLRRILKPLADPGKLPSRPSLVDSIRQLGAGLVVVHLQRTRQHEKAARLAEPRDEPNLAYRLRLYDPQREIDDSALQQIRRELDRAFGSPVHESREVAIYRVR